MRTLARLSRQFIRPSTMSPTTLSHIPTLTQLYASSELQPSSSTRPNATSKYNDKISLIRTDITKLAIDSIVNAANTSLLGGGGVDGAIHSAAGPGLVRECRELDGCDTGDAKITDAYRLPCKKVIHAVGPVYYSTKKQGKHAQLLGSCYTRSLDLAIENGCKSIAFSCLSTGVYGYPSDEAAETAIQTVKGWLEADESKAGKMERVIFCCFLAKDETAYEEYLPQFFPPAAASDDATKANDEKTDTTEGATNAPATESETALPKMPDVPTKEPAEEGQPDAKKVKLSDSDADKEEVPERAKA